MSRLFRPAGQVVWFTFVVALHLFSSPSDAQDSFERKPILYSKTPVDNAITQLQRKLDQGQAQLKFKEEHGYLKSVLQALEIPTSSQMLVFSKTSLQQRLISPSTPRALYFNDDVYVGWVPYGDLLEISVADPVQGAVFYTLQQQEQKAPIFRRDQGNCLTCHASSRTEGVPGHLVRSVYPSPSGLPHFSAGTFNTTQASPFKERWGGWFVTGTHGRQRHMGNVFAADKKEPEKLDLEAGANVTDLSRLTRTNRYLTPHSDIVALMVLEHQTKMHNLITRAGFLTREARYQDEIINRALERKPGTMGESTQRRINQAAEDLLVHLLFIDEIPLTDPVRGTSAFTREFTAQGKKDPHGRSLREFNLNTRLFKHPCSYLIHSDSVKQLPPAIKQVVYRKLWDILTEADQSERFEKLTASDRKAILEILLATHSDLPSYWKANE